MENNEKIISLIMQAVNYLIEKNLDSLCRRSKMFVRTKKNALVREDKMTFLSLTEPNLFIKTAQQTHLDGYALDKDDFEKNAFKVLDGERQLVKDEDEYQVVLLKSDIIIGYGGINKSVHLFTECFTPDLYWEPTRLHLKQKNGFLLRIGSGGRDGTVSKVSIVSLAELEAMHKLLTTMV
ncbi:hypothetical protein KBC03_01780 [Patescibacteria group bacterium]|nr:hypothetical protein [Patescibacteria group bacterium]